MRIKRVIRPVYIVDPDFDDIRPTEPGWYVGSSEYSYHCWSTNEGSHLRFARQADAVAAVEALRAEGIVDDEGMMKLTDDELRLITCSALAW